MTWRWTDELVAPLADRLRDAAWERVEEARDGGWLVLAGESAGESLAWHQLAADGRGELTPVTLLDDQRLAGAQRAIGRWLAAGYAVRVVAHKVGSRATFQLHAAHKIPRQFYAKVYHKNRSLSDRWNALPARGRFCTPRVIGFDDKSQILSIEHVAGTSLNESWRAGHADAADGQLLAELVRWIGSSAPRQSLPSHLPIDEIRLLDERHKAYARTVAQPLAAARALLTAVINALESLPPPVVTLAHRDLHDKQVIVSDESIVLIDLDLIANAPRELDAGNLLGHLRLRALKRFPLPWREIASELTRTLRAQGYGATELRTWTAATLTRLGLIYSHRRHDRELIQQLFKSAADALLGANDWEDVI